MNDWLIDEFRDAASYLVKNCQFMPTPYDFEQLRKKSEVCASEAWSLALDHAGGAWRKGRLGDAMIDRVVAMLGGYRVIALTSADKLGFLEHRFRNAYNDISDANDVREALPNLTETSRSKSGPPVLTRDIDTE